MADDPSSNKTDPKRASWVRYCKQLPIRLIQLLTTRRDKIKAFFEDIYLFFINDFLHDRIIPNFQAFLKKRTLLLWGLALCIGILVAYAAILFRLLISAVQVLWLGTSSEEFLMQARELPWWVIILAPTCGGLLVGILLQTVLPGRRTMGVADVIESCAVKNCKVPLKESLYSALATILSLGSGASAGREGAVVHLGAALAIALQNYFQLSKQARRILLACGVAAAVSASFNAPIAGILFAHEVILTHYALSAFVPIVISSVAATVIAHLHLGNYLAFIVPHYQITSYWEFPAFALLGLTCAAVAILFQYALIFTDRAARNISAPLWSRPVIGGLMVGTLAVFFPEILGVGYSSTNAALNQQLPLTLLFSLLFVKTAATAITLACRFGGGIFSPSLYLGAMTGGAFGLLAASVFPEVASSHGLYAIIGMGAVAAAVLGAPISTALIVFELTGGYDMTIALLLAISISTGLTQAIHGISYFHWQLTQRGLFLDENLQQRVARTILVRDFVILLSEQETLEPLDVLSDDPHLTLDENAEEALKLFERTGDERIPVVDTLTGKQIIGWVDHSNTLDAVNMALIEIHREEHQ